MIERFFWKGIDPLAYYSQRTFAKHIGDTFVVTGGGLLASITLSSVTDILPVGSDRLNGREFFHMLFEGDEQEDALLDGVYILQHRELGSFNMFITSRRSDLFQAVEDDDPIVVSTNTHLYRAIVCRLGYSAMGSLEARNTDWPVGASRFNQESSFSFVPYSTVQLIDDEPVFEEGYDEDDDWTGEGWPLPPEEEE